jgi:SAM-dependent methyltransferase
LLTRARLEKFVHEKKLRQLDEKECDSVAYFTIQHNLEGLFESAEIDRPKTIISPLNAIQKIYKRRENLKVLSIGPRSEYEIFTLFAEGFREENVFALDLITYSPFVDIGDMHASPYEDSSFDIIILGWVISYSKNWELLRKELVRISKPGAVIAISADYSSPETNGERFNNQANHVQSSKDISDLFQNDINKVFFKQDCEMPDVNTNTLIFDIKK